MHFLKIQVEETGGYFFYNVEVGKSLREQMLSFDKENNNVF